jgi:hypothetical protein
LPAKDATFTGCFVPKSAHRKSDTLLGPWFVPRDDVTHAQRQSLCLSAFDLEHRADGLAGAQVIEFERLGALDDLRDASVRANENQM